MSTSAIRYSGILAMALATLALLSAPTEAGRRCRRSCCYAPSCCTPCGSAACNPCMPACASCTSSCAACGTTGTVEVVTNKPSIPAEADHVHCVFVLGTQDDALAGQIRAGGQKVERLFQTPRLKEKITSYTVLQGSDASPDRIRQVCTDLALGPNDSVFFFYHGHGATDPALGHVLLPAAARKADGGLTPGAPLPRAELVDALKSKPHRFICFVTDACSNAIDVSPGAVPEITAPPGAKAAIVSLMLDNTGVLDINSSTYDRQNGIEERSWVTKDGGVMTVAFSRLAMEYGMDRDSDGKVSWKKEFLPTLSSMTDELFQKVKHDPSVLAIQPQILNQSHQSVQRFSHDGTGA